jgi:hypothetical protein
MNISKRDTKMLLILFGIVIFVLCYFLVYLRYVEENEFLTEDIEDAEYEFDRLKVLEGEVARFREEVLLSEEFILLSQAEYPVNVNESDLILYAEELRRNVGINSSNLVFISPVNVMSVRGLAEDEDGNLVFMQRDAYRVGINMNCNMTYQQFKDLVHYIYEESPKSLIHSISISYNSSTGLLHGNVVIHKHFLISNYENYEEVLFPEMVVGLPNPFGVIRNNTPPTPRPPQYGPNTGTD